MDWVQWMVLPAKCNRGFIFAKAVKQNKTTVHIHLYLALFAAYSGGGDRDGGGAFPKKREAAHNIKAIQYIRLSIVQTIAPSMYKRYVFPSYSSLLIRPYGMWSLESGHQLS